MGGQLVNLVPVAFLEFKGKLVTPVVWVPVVLMDCLVNVDCLELLVSVVLVVVLALWVLAVLVVLPEKLVRWDPVASKAHKEMLASVVHKAFKVPLACLVERVPAVTKALLVSECQALQDAQALVVFQVCKDQQVAGALQAPMAKLGCQERRARRQERQ